MKGKKWLTTSITCIFIVLVLMLTMIASCTDENGEKTLAPGETIELKVAQYFPTPTSQAKVLADFCVELEERTSGRVQVDYYDSGTLLGPTDMFQGVIDGVADIGYSHVYYTSGRMPITECAGLPLGYPSGWVGGHVVNE